MADVTVFATASTSDYEAANRRVVFTTSEIGYIFFVDTNSDLYYAKTTDGGASFGTAVVVRSGTVNCFDIWYDRWTPGNTGTLIHIAYQDSVLADILYRSLDTAASDVLNPTVASSAGGTLVFNGASFTLITGTWDTRAITMTRAVGGNLYVYSNPDSFVEAGFYRSTDAGANWTSRALTGGPGGTGRLFMLFPANTSDPQDVVAVVYNSSTTSSPYLAVNDDSANSWATTSLSTAPTMTSGMTTYFPMNASVRQSDDHIELAYWTELDSATADLVFVDINPNTNTAGAVPFTQKTNVITDTAEDALCGVFINQNTNDIYVCYLGGGTFGTSAHAYYKKSTDGGTSWGTQTQLDAATTSALAIWCGLGGTATRFIPAWFAETVNDIFVNKDNSVVIAPAVAADTSFLFPSMSSGMRTLMAR